MTKLSQCAKCVRDRRHCGHYTSEDDTDCPQYKSSRKDDGEEDDFSQKVGIGYAMFYVGLVYVGFAIGFANYFKNPAVYYIFAVPIILLVIWGTVKYVRNRKEKKSIKTIYPDMEQMEIKMPDTTTRTSLMVALGKLNLQYEFDEDQNFLVTYQGEQFRIIAENERIWIQVQDCWWYGASLTDIDNLALLYRAVNECNIRDANKIVYTYNNIEKEIGLHTLRDLLWMPQIPNADQYLQTTFETMLRSHHIFFRMMEDLRREEYEKQNG